MRRFHLTDDEVKALCITIDAELNMRGPFSDTPGLDECLRTARRKFGAAARSAPKKSQPRSPKKKR